MPPGKPTVKKCVIFMVFIIVLWILHTLIEVKTDTPNGTKYHDAFGEKLVDLKLRALENALLQLTQSSQNNNPFRPEDIFSKKNQTQICSVYFKEGIAYRTVIHGVWEAFMKYNKEDITLVTQLSIDRLPSLNRSLYHWTGPFSIALHVDKKQIAALMDIVKQIRNFAARNNVDVHLVLKSGTLYPVNYLRNTALNHTKTNYVYLTDADLVPKVGLHEEMKKMILEGSLNPMQVLVVPAFATTSATLQYPKNKAELLFMWNESKILPFKLAGTTASYGPTDYNRWKYSMEPYSVKYTKHYEPYVIMKRADVPPYNQKFTGHFYDKDSHLLEIHMKGFTYVILPDAFTIHYWHEKSTDLVKYRLHRECAHGVYEEHQKILQRKFSRIDIHKIGQFHKRSTI